MDKNELLEIYGGATLSGPVATVLLKAISYLFDLGRSFGTNFRRYLTGFKCNM